VWEFKLCLRGKLFLAYQPLRPDLQQVFYFAFDTLILPAKNGIEAEEQNPQVIDALSLAKALCDTFEHSGTDVIEVADSGASEAMKRVCLIVATRSEGVINPLEALIRKCLHIPPAYHDAIRDSLTKLLGFQHSVTLLFDSILDDCSYNCSTCFDYLDPTSRIPKLV
jgi:hypothetical protein